MFAGRYDHALDDKGRTMVPKRFRDRLAELGDRSVWITNALGAPPHLDVRPSSLFRDYQERIGSFPETPQLIAYKRFYFGSAVEVELDQVGRILVPLTLRQRCGLVERISFVGLDEHRFQIWPQESLNDELDAVGNNPGLYLEHLAKLGV